MNNRTIANQLTAYAHFLEARRASLHRVQAYRRAADEVLTYPRSMAEIVAESGRDGLEALPGIGEHLSYTIEGLVRTGEFRTLDREGGGIDCEELFGSLPGVGPQLGRRIRVGLGIETLEQLEQAAHHGRLALLGVGRKRLRGIMDALAGRLRRPRIQRARDEPTVGELLAIDREYRERARRLDLPTIAPRRFNPEGKPWLPILEARRGEWHYRALFSNTATAHRLGQTHDWVVIYFEGRTQGQRTVVTERRGACASRRIVRGRERECLEYYRGDAGATPGSQLAGNTSWRPNRE
jgi:hypothetical protein